MLCGRFALPDTDGTSVESVLDELVEKMRPAQREPWMASDHRYADALVQVCRGQDERGEPQTAVPAAPVRLHVQVPIDGPAEVTGVPLRDEWLDAVRAQARPDGLTLRRSTPDERERRRTRRPPAA